MPGPPRPSFPSAPSEPSIRRLGVRSSTSIERPIRSQVVFAVVGALILLAIPLYLMRRPEPEPDPQPTKAPVGFSPNVPVADDQKDGSERVTTDEPVRVKCASNPGARGESGKLCDQLRFFEEALEKAIVETIDCAPRTGKEGDLNYVLKIDFNDKTLHVFPGASGQWRGPQARRAAQCVKQALPMPAWDKIDHKYRYYETAVLATYRPPPPTATPLFE